MKPLSSQLSRPAYENLGEDERLVPLFPEGIRPDLETWQTQRRILRERWDAVLGRPSFGNYDQTPVKIGTFERPEYFGTLFRQPTSPTTRQLVLLMEPKHRPHSPRPGAVVPFYHPDQMAGYDLQKQEAITERREIQFARHLVQQGYVVACPEAFPFNTVPEPAENKGFAWWQAAADKLLHENPHWTGMAKLVWDTRRATDLLFEQADLDKERIVIMGHSLGGKMSFYTGALDERIKAIVASDFGIGWGFTNWDAPWYLGQQIHSKDFTLANHQLLALHAPRSFFLIAGEADRPASWQYLNAAKQVYRLYGKEDAVGCFDHGSGHSPTHESLRLAYRWLAEQFELPEQAWEL